MTTFGIEEEYFLLHSETLEPVNLGGSVRDQLLRGQPDSEFVSYEFLASQIERSSPVFELLDHAEEDLSAFRSSLANAAAEHGVIAAAVGTPFETIGSPSITDVERYHSVESEFRGLVTDHLICGTHVHVGIPSREAGVAALNRVRVWLPTMLSLGGNSPYWRAADTGFASWRAVHMRRWSTTGCPPPFADAADYDRRIHSLVGVGGTHDVKTVGWFARLAEQYPTLEVRVSDAQLDLPTTLLLAALTRALVVTALVEAEAGIAPIAIEPELLDVSLWHAARDGIGESLLDPGTGLLRPASEVVDSMIAYVTDALDAEGDTARVTELLARLRSTGTGAARQRNAMRSGGRVALGALLSSALTER